MADAKSAPKKRAPQRTPAEIERELATIRARLADDVATLVDQVHPQHIKQREIAHLKSRVTDAGDRVKLQFVTADGAPRAVRLVAIGAAVVGVVGFVVVVKTLGSRRARQ